MSQLQYFLLTAIALLAIAFIAWIWPPRSWAEARTRRIPLDVSFGVSSESVCAATETLVSDDVTDWFPAEIKPVHIGEYRVRMPWTTVTSIQRTRWDGGVWRDLHDDRECYFQNLQWQGMKKSCLE